MADYFQVKNQNIFNPPANTSLGNATNQFNDVYVQNDLVLGNVTVTGTTIIAPRITTITYPGDDTAADTAGGQTITLTGTGFVAGANLLINGSAVGVVSVVSSTTITFTSPANTTGSYVIYVINPDGSTAIAIPGIQYSGTPTWTTAAGTLGNVYETANFTQTVTATGDAPITYSVVSGSLPPGSTFNANGTITGTSQLSASPTTYSFTVRATDAEQQDTNRAFSIAVIPDVVTWSNPTDNATYTPAANVAISNITLSATSAVGSGITYSANTLPTGLSLTGANISGTPTVIANTSSLLTATANTTTESSSITINWVVSVASDPYFMYNSLLLPGTGTNGAQNNTFLDGSTNNFTITRAGNTTQGTFSPYGPNWSIYQDNVVASYLNFTTSVGSAFQFTGDFTIEAWVYYTSLSGDASLYVSSDSSSYFAINISMSAGVYNIYLNSGSPTSSFSHGISVNTWTHVAMVRSGSTVTLYTNGVSKGTLTNSSTVSYNSPSINRTGGGVSGVERYLSNFRVVKGAAVYTSAFTPSTTPLTAISGTSLLIGQSNRFIDNSTNAFAITLSGTPTIQRFSPFSPTAAYSTSTIGGSGYFDGTGDYLVSTSSASNILGSGDFTIEFWLYPSNTSSAYRALVSSENYAGTTGGWSLYQNGTGIEFWLSPGGSVTLNATSAITSSTWQHVALCRASGTLRLFINGTSVASVANSTSLTGQQIWIGDNNSGSYFFDGYISNLRVVVGTAVYTSAFTPPTAPVTAISGTSLLLNYTNAGIIDNTMINNVETVGNAQISTAQTKFGGGSMYFDGTGDYLNAIPNVAFTYGTGSFTIEGWHYLTAASSATKYLFDQRVSGNGYFPALYVSSGQYIVYINSATPLVAGTVVANTWVHWALVKNSATSTTTLYINGTQAGSFVDTNNYSVIAQFRVGSEWTTSGLYDWQGYMDDLRITKGYARYTSTFTPPIAAFPTY